MVLVSHQSVPIIAISFVSRSKTILQHFLTCFFFAAGRPHTIRIAAGGPPAGAKRESRLSHTYWERARFTYSCACVSARAYICTSRETPTELASDPRGRTGPAAAAKSRGVTNAGREGREKNEGMVGIMEQTQHARALRLAGRSGSFTGFVRRGPLVCGIHGPLGRSRRRSARLGTSRNGPIGSIAQRSTTGRRICR